MIEVTVFRVLIELINNTIKYAEAKNVNIEINKDKSILLIQYTDDGQGFNYEKTFTDKKGFGLININSRINSLNGKLNIQSKIGKGLQVSIKLNML